MKTATIVLYGLLSLLGKSDAQPHRGRQHQDFQPGKSVRTDSGAVKGHAAAVATSVSEYLGIPYAKPPVGELRFARPQRYSGKGTINGTAFVGLVFKSVPDARSHINRGSLAQSHPSSQIHCYPVQSRVSTSPPLDTNCLPKSPK
jgi:hypothetical protein